MKIEDFDNRYRELQQDLINTLSTEQLLELEADVPVVARRAMEGLRKAFLILVGVSVGMAILGTQVQDKKILWFLSCLGWSTYMALEKFHGFQWALEFTNSKGQKFCLPKWLNLDDDSRRLRSWRETVGQPCRVQAVELPVRESLAIKHRTKEAISFAIGAVLFWLIGGWGFKVHGDGGGGSWNIFVTGCVICAVFKFYNSWLGSRFEPHLYGEGYPEIISTLDTRGTGHGQRRQR